MVDRKTSQDRYQAYRSAVANLRKGSYLTARQITEYCRRHGGTFEPDPLATYYRWTGTGTPKPIQRERLYSKTKVRSSYITRLSCWERVLGNVWHCRKCGTYHLSKLDLPDSCKSCRLKALVQRNSDAHSRSA